MKRDLKLMLALEVLLSEQAFDEVNEIIHGTQLEPKLKSTKMYEVAAILNLPETRNSVDLAGYISTISLTIPKLENETSNQATLNPVIKTGLEILTFSAWRYIEVRLQDTKVISEQTYLALTAECLGAKGLFSLIEERDAKKYGKIKQWLQRLCKKGSSWNFNKTLYEYIKKENERSKKKLKTLIKRFLANVHPILFGPTLLSHFWEDLKKQREQDSKKYKCRQLVMKNLENEDFINDFKSSVSLLTRLQGQFSETPKTNHQDSNRLILAADQVKSLGEPTLKLNEEEYEVLWESSMFGDDDSDLGKETTGKVQNGEPYVSKERSAGKRQRLKNSYVTPKRKRKNVPIYKDSASSSSVSSARGSNPAESISMSSPSRKRTTPFRRVKSPDPTSRVIYIGSNHPKRVKFTEKEEQILVDEVLNNGKLGKWAEILNENRNCFHPSRTSVSLKDKWRNVIKKRRITQAS